MAQHGFIHSQKGSEPRRQEQGWGDSLWLRGFPSHGICRDGAAPLLGEAAGTDAVSCLTRAAS